MAQVRVPSLSSVANRYIALTPGPEQQRPRCPPARRCRRAPRKEVTDLDQLFNTLNPKTRKGLQEFIQGTAEQYAGSGKAARRIDRILRAGARAAIDHFFAELTRDQPMFTNFLVETAKAVTTIGARHEQLADLIENANTTFKAIGDQQAQLRRRR